MMRVFPRTRETERAWKMALISVGVCLVLSPIVIPIFGKYPALWFEEVSLTAAPVFLQTLTVAPNN